MKNNQPNTVTKKHKNNQLFKITHITIIIVFLQHKK